MTVGPWVDRSYVGLLVDDSRLLPGMRAALDKAMGPLQAQADRAADGIAKSFDQVDDHAAKVFDRVRLAGRDATEDLGVYFDVAAARIDRALDGVGDNAFAGLRSQAATAAEGIEGEFEEAQRQADDALDDIGGPGQFTGITTQAKVAGERIERSFRGAGISAGVSLGALRASAVGAGGVIAAALGAVGGAAVTMGLQAAASMEQAEISFTQLLGSGREAKAFLADLNQFAATTPFELPGLIAAARQLMGAGQAASDVIPIMTALGDATGALGLTQEQFSRIMLATTQSMNKGKLQGEELLQFLEAGIPIWQLMADATGLPIPKLREMSEKGELLAKDVLPKLFDQMRKDYGGSMAKQAQTLNGLWSTFMDTLRNSLREGLEPMIPIIKDVLPQAAEALGGAIRSISGFMRGDLGPELGRLRTAWDENSTAIIGLVTNITGYESAADGGSQASRDLVDALVQVTNAAGDTADIGGDLGNALNRANEASQSFGAQIHENAVGPFEEWIAQTGFGKAVTREWGELLNTGKLALADLGIELDDNTTSTQNASSASQDHAAALRNQRNAVNELKDALQVEKDAHLEVRQAELNVQVAQKRLNELKRDGKQGSMDYRQAQLNLERAQSILRRETNDYRQAVDRSTDRERVAASASDRLRGAKGRYREEADRAGRMGRLFGERVRDGILRIPKGREIRVQATFGFKTPPEMSMHDIVGRAQGGKITEGTGPTADDVLIRASKGETVVSARDSARPEFQGWARERGIPGFQEGGAIGRVRLNATFADPRQLERAINRFEGVIDRAAVSLRDKFANAAASMQLLSGGSGAGFGSGSWIRAVKELQADRVPFSVISTFRRGARTAASGSVSFHALNRAVDLVGPNMLAIWRALTDTNPTELIYSRAPLYKSRRGWNPISQLDPITRGDHYSHVHAAYDGGGYLRPGWTTGWNGTGRQERVLDPEETRIWEALERRLGAQTAPVASAGPQTVVNVAAGAVQIDARGATKDAAPAIRASVEDGLAEVLRQFRTGSRP